MHIDIPETKAKRYRARKTLGDRVREALLLVAGSEANLLTHEETPWASITFAGTRHELTVEFNGIAACKAGERFIATLPDHEFTIPNMLVADATISEVESSYTPEPRMVVTATLLLLEEA
ncbi:hypothetical protein [Altererythrobacter lutimaris]|uniref:Uncharacterized protein n=1 Tax=Altererythrobacter lutimaris TaxID=2743979 RepID=A0A850HAJ5_9SPHN|nr:hypothetical protein [Altererythrobacter lutimaris]NVE94265.1 hypothetical protein [Altererythrobacter lutimaris]